jgi:hypothetical protein
VQPKSHPGPTLPTGKSWQEFCKAVREQLQVIVGGRAVPCPNGGSAACTHTRKRSAGPAHGLGYGALSKITQSSRIMGRSPSSVDRFVERVIG